MMQFSRVISLLGFFALGTLALATPLSQIGKRDNAAIENVIQNLKSSTDSILPQISKFAFCLIMRVNSFDSIWRCAGYKWKCNLRHNHAPHWTAYYCSWHCVHWPWSPRCHPLFQTSDQRRHSWPRCRDYRSTNVRMHLSSKSLLTSVLSSQDITNALDTLLGDASAIPELGDLLAGVDTSLDQVLTGLEILLAGASVLNLVANLWDPIFNEHSYLTYIDNFIL